MSGNGSILSLTAWGEAPDLMAPEVGQACMTAGSPKGPLGPDCVML